MPPSAGGPGDLHRVAELMDGAERSRARLEKTLAGHPGFNLLDQQARERLLFGPLNRLYVARYRMDVWRAGRARVVWFAMESDIPHFSSIVACVAEAIGSNSCPMFVMNLNLKLKAGTYNTIMGFRGAPSALRSAEDVVRLSAVPGNGAPRPVLTKPNPAGFVGLRCMFWLRDAPIDWSLQLADKALCWWQGTVNEDRPVAEEPNGDWAARYQSESLARHGREGGVYDAVFGDGWLTGLFSGHVFPAGGGACSASRT
jgi:hypothetical protein